MAYKINKRPMDDSDDEEQKNEESNARYELGYWKIQGLASPARMMLVFADVPFKNQMFEVTQTKAKKDGSKEKGWELDGTVYDLSDWQSVKFTKGLDFPNLPHFIDHKTGFKLSQAKSIYRFIAREFKIGVQTDPNLAVADMMTEMVGQVMGVDSPLPRSAPFIFLSYDGFGSEDAKTKLDFETKTKNYVADMAKPETALGANFKQIEGFMLNKHFVTGHEISYADFCLYYLCVTHNKLDSAFATRFPNLSAFFKRMGELEGMKRWHRSSMAKLPFNNVMAKFK